jgi:hypothetical protein
MKLLIFTRTPVLILALKDSSEEATNAINALRDANPARMKNAMFVSTDTSLRITNVLRNAEMVSLEPEESATLAKETARNA